MATKKTTKKPVKKTVAKKPAKPLPPLPDLTGLTHAQVENYIKQIDAARYSGLISRIQAYAQELASHNSKPKTVTVPMTITLSVAGLCNPRDIEQSIRQAYYPDIGHKASIDVVLGKNTLSAKAQKLLIAHAKATVSRACGAIQELVPEFHAIATKASAEAKNLVREVTNILNNTGREAI